VPLLAIGEIQELRARGLCGEAISAIADWRKEQGGLLPTPLAIEDGWAHYQLGNYERARAIMLRLAADFSADSAVGQSARLCLAHCAERQGDLDDAQNLLDEIPPGSARDNLYVTVLIAKRRKDPDLLVPAAKVMDFIIEALKRAPYHVVDAHIINNVTLLLHEARQQKDVKPYLSSLCGLIEVAIGIYEETNAPENHRAAALYRASLIFEAADWLEGSLVVIRESIAKWQKLVSSQGGERYRKNLNGAQEQLKKLEKLATDE